MTLPKFSNTAIVRQNTIIEPSTGMKVLIQCLHTFNRKGIVILNNTLDIVGTEIINGITDVNEQGEAYLLLHNYNKHQVIIEKGVDIALYEEYDTWTEQYDIIPLPSIGADRVPIIVDQHYVTQQDFHHFW